MAYNQVVGKRSAYMAIGFYYFGAGNANLNYYFCMRKAAK